MKQGWEHFAHAEDSDNFSVDDQVGRNGSTFSQPQVKGSGSFAENGRPGHNCNRSWQHQVLELQQPALPGEGWGNSYSNVPSVHNCSRSSQQAWDVLKALVPEHALDSGSREENDHDHCTFHTQARPCCRRH